MKGEKLTQDFTVKQVVSNEECIVQANHNISVKDVNFSFKIVPKIDQKELFETVHKELN